MSKQDDRALATDTIWVVLSRNGASYGPIVLWSCDLVTSCITFIYNFNITFVTLLLGRLIAYYHMLFVCNNLNTHRNKYDNRHTASTSTR